MVAIDGRRENASNQAASRGRPASGSPHGLRNASQPTAAPAAISATVTASPKPSASRSSASSPCVTLAEWPAIHVGQWSSGGRIDVS